MKKIWKSTIISILKYLEHLKKQKLTELQKALSADTVDLRDPVTLANTPSEQNWNLTFSNP